MTSSGLFDILKAVELFSDLDRDGILTLADQAKRIDLAARQQLFHQGEPGDVLYVLAEGELHVHDDKTVFNTLTAPASFGEFALLESITRTASVTATTPAVIYAFGKDAFFTLLRSNFEVTHAIIQGLIRRIAKEKDMSESLLQQMLPREIAEEYKANGFVKVKRHEQVTVMFSDFEGFTRVSAAMPPDWVISELDHCFSSFDRITDRYGIRKIKTIGDGYMCVGGIPNNYPSSALDVVLAALEMQQFLAGLARTRRNAGFDFWGCRIGINTGDCVSAVIGETKLTYDVWSDTVNTASRLETAAQSGRVNVGESTYRQVSAFFDFEPKANVQDKDKGLIGMYLVKSIKAELSVDGRGLEPNDAFLSLREQRLGSS